MAIKINTNVFITNTPLRTALKYPTIDFVISMRRDEQNNFKIKTRASKKTRRAHLPIPTERIKTKQQDIKWTNWQNMNKQKTKDHIETIDTVFFMGILQFRV